MLCIAKKRFYLEVCLGVSKWSLSVSGDVLKPNMFAQIHMGHDSSYIAFSSRALNTKKSVCLVGVWMVSVGV